MISLRGRWNLWGSTPTFNQYTTTDNPRKTFYCCYSKDDNIVLCIVSDGVPLVCWRTMESTACVVCSPSIVCSVLLRLTVSLVWGLSIGNSLLAQPCHTSLSPRQILSSPSLASYILSRRSLGCHWIPSFTFGLPTGSSTLYRYTHHFLLSPDHTHQKHCDVCWQLCHVSLDPSLPPLHRLHSSTTFLLQSRPNTNHISTLIHSPSTTTSQY